MDIKILNVFDVKGRKEMTISKLRKIIYEKNKNDFTNKGFDINKLVIWTVNIPGNVKNFKKLKLLEEIYDIDNENIIIQKRVDSI